MSKAPEPKNEIATVQAGLPAEMMEDMAQFAGAGVSERSQDFLLPFLAIAQSNSPQLKRQQADKYIAGLEAGDIFNTATGKIYKAEVGIPVIQVWFQKAWVEWVLRDEGGGYVATYSIDDPIQKQARAGGDRNRFFLLPNHHQLVDTSYHFVMDPESGSVAVVSMTSTGLQCSRMWQTMMKEMKVPFKGELIVAPSFSRVYRLRSAYKKNDQGDWFTWSVADEGVWSVQAYPQAYNTAKKFYLEAKEHGVVLGRPPLDDAGSSNVEGDPPI